MLSIPGGTWLEFAIDDTWPELLEANWDLLCGSQPNWSAWGRIVGPTVIVLLLFSLTVYGLAENVSTLTLK